MEFYLSDARPCDPALLALMRAIGSQVGQFIARKAAEEEIRQLAFYDPLTGLPNRRLLRDRLQRALVASQRSKRYGAVLFIDLDHFKTINDTLGHDKGDLLLQQVAERLTRCLRLVDTVGRQGGDEFVVMLMDLSETASEAMLQAQSIGEKMRAALY
jgi:diguanylate cyclase (GGDEF)-like protein